MESLTFPRYIRGLTKSQLLSGEQVAEYVQQFWDHFNLSGDLLEELVTQASSSGGTKASTGASSSTKSTSGGNQPTVRVNLRQLGLEEHVKESSTVPALETVEPDWELVEVDKFGKWLVSEGHLTQWQHEQLRKGRHRGFFLDKYRILRHLGSGGMGRVYLAEHVRMHRLVALKVLPEKLVGDRSYLERFYREARAIAAVDHPNIIQAYSVDHHQGLHYLVMQFVEGIDLGRLVLTRGLPPIEEAADYMRQAAEGLAHAHSRGLIHRDIKPSNLLVDEQGQVKILDLGLAQLKRNSEKDLTLVHDEKVIGTADFLSPEQARNSHDVDHRCDLYSLGTTLYFLLCGRPPFQGGTMAQRLIQHQTAEPTDPRTWRPEVPASLVGILRRLMAKNPDDRYSSAGAVQDVLAEWLARPNKDDPQIDPLHGWHQDLSDPETAPGEVVGPPAVGPPFLGRDQPVSLGAVQFSSARAACPRPTAKRPDLTWLYLGGALLALLLGVGFLTWSGQSSSKEQQPSRQGSLKQASQPWSVDLPPLDTKSSAHPEAQVRPKPPRSVFPAFSNPASSKPAPSSVPSVGAKARQNPRPDRPQLLPGDSSSRPALLTLFEDEGPLPYSLGPGSGPVQTPVVDFRYTGAASFAVLPKKIANGSEPAETNRQTAWNLEIRQNPGPGQYRYLRFCWRKMVGTSAGFQLLASPPQDGPGPSKEATRRAYFAGRRPSGWKQSKRVGEKLPQGWELVTADLFEDFGEFTLDGVALHAFDGLLLVDHVYLARSQHDLVEIPLKELREAVVGQSEDVVREATDPRQYFGILRRFAGSLGRSLRVGRPCGLGGLALLREYRGRSNVLRSHPLSRDVPFSILVPVTVPEDKKVHLEVFLSHHSQGDWDFGRTVVRGGSQQVRFAPVNAQTARLPGGWLAVQFDLSQFAGSTVTVALVHKASGWDHEFAYWADLRVVVQK